jgi:imidazolonepropionase
MVIRHATQLLTLSDADLGIIEDGAVVIEQGRITWSGRTAEIPTDLNSPTADDPGPAVDIDASGCVVMPGFVDCHTHLVFGGWRDDEFEMRLAGRTYKEIGEAGGGILNTVRKTRAASETELLTAARQRLNEMRSWGTTTCEIKSGYGLDTETELKMLRVIRQLATESNGMTVVPTFLGAHSVPPGRTKAEYIDLLINEMIPRVGATGLAQFCDVFCENFVFTATESRRILEAGKRYGLLPKIHADEIEPSGGAETAAAVGAISAEHLLVPSDAGLQAMKDRGVVAVLLPGTSFFLGSRPAPVSRMRELGVLMALGSDCNPGSCTLLAMPLAISLACIHYRMTIKEAVLGATLNAARALKLETRKGSLEPGKDADIQILAIPGYRHLPYRLGHNPVRTVIAGGKVLLDRASRT